MDPKTGDILALANFPTYDPNEPPKPDSLGARENLAISAPFEPGSVYKVITLSSALETTQLRPESMINCGSGQITLFGRTIHDHSRYCELIDGRCAGAIEQHRRHQHRADGRRKEFIRIYPEIWVRQEDGNPAAGRIGGNASGR